MINNYNCKTCNKWSKCECGEKGYKNNTSIRYLVGVCKNYVLNELPNINSQKIGYWKVNSNKNIIICCNCETWFNNDRLQLMRHCPYCGIEMRGAYETIN